MKITYKELWAISKRVVTNYSASYSMTNDQIVAMEKAVERAVHSVYFDSKKEQEDDNV